MNRLLPRCISFISEGRVRCSICLTWHWSCKEYPFSIAQSHINSSEHRKASQDMIRNYPELWTYFNTSIFPKTFVNPAQCIEYEIKLYNLKEPEKTSDYIPHKIENFVPVIPDENNNNSYSVADRDLDIAIRESLKTVEEDERLRRKRDEEQKTYMENWNTFLKQKSEEIYCMDEDILYP